jgi:hypothetical protein
MLDLVGDRLPTNLLVVPLKTPKIMTPLMAKENQSELGLGWYSFHS